MARTLEINSGADLMMTGPNGLRIAVGGDGTLVVDGAGSSIKADTSDSVWGGSGGAANITFRNESGVSFANIGLADSNFNATVGDLSIESGAGVSTGKPAHRHAWQRCHGYDHPRRCWFVTYASGRIRVSPLAAPAVPVRPQSMSRNGGRIHYRHGGRRRSTPRAPSMHRTQGDLATFNGRTAQINYCWR